MLFDQPPVELPIATLRPRNGAAAVAADLRRWLFTRWQWLRPRTVPMIVAFVGLLAVVGSGRYLSRYAEQPPEQLTVTPDLAERRLAALREAIDRDLAPTVIELETLQTWWDLTPIPMWPSQTPIHVVPAR